MKRFYKINQYIQAEKLRVVDEKGNQLGILTREEALFRARQKGLDLVEVAEKAQPPVAKLIDFKKFKYQEDKKLRAGKKGKSRQDTKEIRFTPFIAKNDFNIRVEKAKQFLQDGHKLRLTVKFIGRQMTRREFGYQLLKRAISELKGLAKTEDEPKWSGRLLSVILKPTKKQDIQENKEKVTKKQGKQKKQNKKEKKDAKTKN